MMKRLLILALFATLTAAAQPKQSVAAYAIGDFNPTTYIRLNSQGGHYIIASNASKAGGGAEYTRFFTPHFGYGVTYYQNPSDGKLFVQSGRYIGPGIPLVPGIWGTWPQMRYETDALLTARFPAWHGITAFLQGGIGFVVTNGYSNSGWSANVGPAGGYGADFAVSQHWAWRVKTTLEVQKEGCYGDSTCTPSPGITQVVATGPVFEW